jgi:hypothetical protein
MGRYPELDLAGVRTTPLAERESLVSVDDFLDADRLPTDRDPLDAMPAILAGAELRLLADEVARAAREGRAVVVMLGGHVVKTGVSPCLRRLIEAGVITALAANGSVAIHDGEIALVGHTSERVDRGLGTGDFGIAEETAALVNGAAVEARERGEGFGEALGRKLVELAPRFERASLLAAAYRHQVPFTLHVAIGTDIVHQHASCDGAAVGEASLRDFRILAAALRNLDGGVVVNLGSAVILPEVFVKALNVARNLGYPSDRLTSANFDFIQHYRPRQNVLSRPTARGGRAIALTGHHEVLVPLFTAAVLYRLG